MNETKKKECVEIIENIINMKYNNDSEFMSLIHDLMKKTDADRAGDIIFEKKNENLDSESLLNLMIADSSKFPYK